MVSTVPSHESDRRAPRGSAGMVVVMGGCTLRLRRCGCRPGEVDHLVRERHLARPPHLARAGVAHLRSGQKRARRRSETLRFHRPDVVRKDHGPGTVAQSHLEGDGAGSVAYHRSPDDLRGLWCELTAAHGHQGASVRRLMRKGASTLGRQVPSIPSARPLA
jgi:hypothetical protein